MGSQEAGMTFDSTDGVNDLESKQAVMGMEQDDNLNVGFLEDWDTMMEDVENRLRVARMVSDSVIKGMVSAVEQDADEKIKAKELELERFKKSAVDFKGYASFEDVCLKHDQIKDSVTNEFKSLRKQIEGVNGFKIKRNGSCHEMVGLGGILKDKCDLDKTVDNLENIMNNMSKLVDTAIMFSKNSLCEWQHKHEVEEVGSQSLYLTENFSSILDLKKELEMLKKLIPSSDSGHLISHGSLDIDTTHGNPLRSQLSTRWEENGESTESTPDVANNFDASSLNHLKREELVKFFNNLISELKRDHEAEVHEITDRYISLRGKYLGEMRSSVPPNKDFEVLKKKIPEVVAKLDNLLHQSDGFIGKGDTRIGIDTVLEENRQIKDSIAVMKDEAKNLSFQLNVVSEKYKSLKADKFLEASIVEDVYKCVIRELNHDFQNMKEESELKVIAMQDVYEVLLESISIGATEDTRMELLFMQELTETVFKETLIDVNQKMESLHEKYITTNENLVSLESKAMKMEAEIILKSEESKKLRNQVNLLKDLMEEKDTSARDEIDNLKNQLLKSNKEFDGMSEKLSKVEEKLLSEKMEINVHKNKVIDLSNEKQSLVSLVEEKERKHRKQMEGLVVRLDELSTNFDDFEYRVTRDVRNNHTRLDNSRTQLSSLITAVNELKNSKIICEQQLERKCCDLEMAEEEVDLLGDEVDTLLGHLEKIYIALDHYSPVLQHYPGIIEILELVRRELSGESLKQL